MDIYGTIHWDPKQICTSALRAQQYNPKNVPMNAALRTTKQRGFANLFVHCLALHIAIFIFLFLVSLIFDWTREGSGGWMRWMDLICLQKCFVFVTLWVLCLFNGFMYGEKFSKGKGGGGELRTYVFLRFWRGWFTRCSEE